MKMARSPFNSFKIEYDLNGAPEKVILLYAIPFEDPVPHSNALGCVMGVCVETLEQIDELMQHANHAEVSVLLEAREIILMIEEAAIFTPPSSIAPSPSPGQ